jgi:UDP-glucose 4-epimerase
MNILVTGGLGFIGSHICVELLNKHYNVYIIDNLENSKSDIIDKIHNITLTKTNKQASLFIFDLTDKKEVDAFFSNHSIDIIIHCAGLKSVNKSIEVPLLYYNNNILMTLNLLDNVARYNIKEFIFSSSATVYGKQLMERNSSDYKSLLESDNIGCGISNPYGKSKYIQEIILEDFYRNKQHLNCVILRYFNPVGCHKSGIIGENPKGIPNNLMPYLLKVATNNNNNICETVNNGNNSMDIYKYLNVFGDDYNTCDGTCIRDYIHVCDLANAHIETLNFDKKMERNYWVFNVGNNKGTSVVEMIRCFEVENNINIPYKIINRRNGDEPYVVCNNDKIIKYTNWIPKYGLNDIVIDCWNFICKN